MMKWIFGLLILVNIGFFAVMQWGSALTIDTSNPQIQSVLNADKIKIVSMVAPSAPVSAVAVASSGVAATSAPSIASSAPAMVLPVSAVVSLVPLPAKLSCMEWGEFSGAELRRADNALAPLKLGERSKQRLVEYNSGYWVFIGPLKSIAQVKMKIGQLKKLDVQDYFVMKESGPWKNAISLGLFKTEDAAKKFMVKLKDQGVKSAKVGTRASKLKFTTFTLSRLDSTASSQVLALRKDFPESEIKTIPCN